MGIILFNTLEIPLSDVVKSAKGFRPLMGIILFNYPASWKTINSCFIVRFRPLMGIILFNKLIYRNH